MNYRYRNNKNYQNNQRQSSFYNDMANYYRQFPSYTGESFSYYPNSLSSVERRPNYMPIFEDIGPEPFVINIEEAAEINNYFRQAIWTGEHLQVTLMSIEVGSDIGYEVHPNIDQFIRIEDGEGLVIMGDSMDNFDFEEPVYEDYALVIPAGKWHNLINTGNVPIKLYSIYAPVAHPHGTIHQTKEIAMEEET